MHPSFIIAVEWIEVIHHDRIEINTDLIPISDTYRKAFKELIDNRHIGKI